MRRDSRTLRPIVLGWTADWFFTFPCASLCERGQFIGMEIPNIGFLDVKTLSLKDWAEWQDQAEAATKT